MQKYGYKYSVFATPSAPRAFLGVIAPATEPNVVYR
jgi:hypothetical protein